MKRPNKDNYPQAICNYQCCKYINKLDLYCDELERALDKACEVIEIAHKELSEKVGGGCKTKEQWKEWIIKDEKL